MKKLIFIAAVMAATLASCQKKEKIESVANTDRGDGSISFSSYTQKTKASIAYLDTLKKNGFGVFGIENEPDESSGEPTTWTPALPADFFYDEAQHPYNLQEVKYDLGDGKWTYTPVKYWSDDERVTMDFIAFSPYDEDVEYTPGSSAELSASASFGPFTIEGDITQQKDYLVATKFDLPQVQKIVLEYQHALARIGFSAYSPALEGGDYIVIDTIQLCANTTTDHDDPDGFFRDQGKINIKRAEEYPEGWRYSLSWTLTGKKQFAYTLNHEDMEEGGRISQTPARLNQLDKYIMVMPQENLGNMQIYVKYTVYRGGTAQQKEKTFDCPVAAFKMGTAYTFNFNLGVSEVAFDCMVTPWDEQIYSLNASGEVYASSSREDCQVYVNAQRMGSSSVKYDLYAEMKTVREDNDSVRMFPVWKLINKSFNEPGYVVPGDLVFVYLGVDELPGIELYETDIDNNRYTVLSFTINDETRAELATSYYAEYIEDPISAYVYCDNKTVKNSVRVNRMYSPYEEFIYNHPYVSTVTLSITNRPSAPFVKWQGSPDGGNTWYDLPTGSGSEFVLGDGYSLTFEENNVYYWESYQSEKFVYRAVFGSFSEGIGIFKGRGITSTTPSDIAYYKSSAVLYPEGTDIEMIAEGPDAGETFKFRMASNDGMESWKELVDGKGGFTIKQDVDGNYHLTFSLTQDLNGMIFDAYYEKQITTEAFLNEITASGVEIGDVQEVTGIESGVKYYNFTFSNSIGKALNTDDVLLRTNDENAAQDGRRWIQARQLMAGDGDLYLEQSKLGTDFWMLHAVLKDDYKGKGGFDDFLFMINDSLKIKGQTSVYINLPEEPETDAWKYTIRNTVQGDTVDITDASTIVLLNTGDTLNVITNTGLMPTTFLDYKKMLWKDGSVEMQAISGSSENDGDMPVGFLYELEVKSK